MCITFNYSWYTLNVKNVDDRKKKYLFCLILFGFLGKAFSFASNPATPVIFGVMLVEFIISWFLDVLTNGEYRYQVRKFLEM